MNAHQWTVFMIALIVSVTLVCAGLLLARVREKRRSGTRLRAEANRMVFYQQWRTDNPPPVRTMVISPHSSKRPDDRAVAPQRKPRNPNLLRVRCPECDHLITVNKDGTLRSHAGPYYSRATYCSGSGRKAFSYIVRENPYS